MKKIYFKAVLICFLQILFFISCNISNSSKDYTLYVNPLIGTTGDNPTQYGGTIPAVLTPFGMTHWTAMTRQNKIGACPYHYDDTAIIGFIGTHQPAVWMGDYGQMSFMPQTKLNTNINTRGINYEHQNEYSKPDHYNVILDNEISVDFSATTRCGIFQVNFPVKEQSFIVIDASRDENKKGFIKIIPEKKQIVGYNSDRHS